jgi:hypothetical protein
MYSTRICIQSIYLRLYHFTVQLCSAEFGSHSSAVTVTHHYVLILEVQVVTPVFGSHLLSLLHTLPFGQTRSWANLFIRLWCRPWNCGKSLGVVACRKKGSGKLTSISLILNPNTWHSRNASRVWARVSHNFDFALWFFFTHLPF